MIEAISQSPTIDGRDGPRPPGERVLAGGRRERGRARARRAVRGSMMRSASELRPVGIRVIARSLPVGPEVPDPAGRTGSRVAAARVRRPAGGPRGSGGQPPRGPAGRPSRRRRRLHTRSTPAARKTDSGVVVPTATNVAPAATGHLEVHRTCPRRRSWPAGRPRARPGPAGAPPGAASTGPRRPSRGRSRTRRSRFRRAMLGSTTARVDAVTRPEADAVRTEPPQRLSSPRAWPAAASSPSRRSSGRPSRPRGCSGIPSSSVRLAPVRRVALAEPLAAHGDPVRAQGDHVGAIDHRTSCPRGSRPSRTRRHRGGAASSRRRS